MRILLTGGGTGGHIFPLISVARQIQKIEKNSQLIFLGPIKGYEAEFVNSRIRIHHIITGKIRRYFSIYYLIDIPKITIGFIQAYFYLFKYMPDVVFSKGGYGAFPVIIVAWIFRIPVISHESDSVAGLTNRILSKFSKQIIVSFPSKYPELPSRKIIYIGNPTIDYRKRKSMKNFLNLQYKKPLIFITGGSQGSEQINNLTFSSLDSFLTRYEIVHQVGQNNIQHARQIKLEIDHKIRKNYHCVAFLDEDSMRQVFHYARLVVSRAGSGSITEIALNKKPSILIPLASSASNHQQKNAKIYEKSGCCVVLDPLKVNTESFEEAIKKLMNNKAKKIRMSRASHKFAKPDSAKKIAKLILSYGK